MTRVLNVLQRSWLWIIAISTLIAYFPVFANNWVNWDDGEYVVYNHVMKAPDGLSRIWITREIKDYPPLEMTFLYLQYKLWGDRPGGYHGVSLLLHIINALLVCHVCRKLGVTNLAALGIAMLFALHPVQVESVAWVTEQKNLLYALFGWCALLAFIQYRDTARVRWLGMSLMLFILALLSKMMIVSLPCILLAVDWLRRKPWTLRGIAELIPFFIVAAALTQVLFSAHSEMIAASSGNVHHTLAERMIIIGRTLWFYPLQLLWPAPLIAIYNLWELRTDSLFSYLPLAGMIAACATLAALYRARRISRLTIFAVLYYLFSIAPVSGVVDWAYMDKSYVADRYQYTPCLGLLMLVGLAGTHIRTSRRTTVLVLCIMVTSILGVMTWRQTGVWAGSLPLWRHCASHNPDSAHVQHALASALKDLGALDGAEEAVRRALAIRPNLTRAHVTLGHILLQRGQLAQAARSYEQAIRLAPRIATGHLYLGETRARAGDVDGAIAAVKKALELSPNSVAARTELIRLLMRADRQGEAEHHIDSLRKLGDYDWKED